MNVLYKLKLEQTQLQAYHIEVAFSSPLPFPNALQLEQTKVLPNLVAYMMVLKLLLLLMVLNRRIGFQVFQFVFACSEDWQDRHERENKKNLARLT